MKDISQLDMTKSYTYADYLTWEFDEMVELIKGKIFRMSPAPLRGHQRVVNTISFAFNLHLQNKPCHVYEAPFEVRLLRSKNESKVGETVVQPDICVVCDLSKLNTKGCAGAPDLIVEVLSLSTRKKDYSEKFNLYQENGVKEYWIADPATKSLEVYTLTGEEYSLHQLYEKAEEIVTSPLFPEFKARWDDIFNGV